MRRESETAIGAAVLAFGALILGLTYGSSGRASMPGYDLVARFNKAEGVSSFTDVRLGGMVVGKVVGQSLDDNFRAVIRIRIDPTLKLPDDTAALIQTDGLLGAKYISLQPGAEDNILKPGDEIQYTQDSVNVQDLLELIIAQAKAKRAARAQDSNTAKP